MVGSIVFERFQENALNELKKYLSQVDVVITVNSNEKGGFSLFL